PARRAGPGALGREDPHGDARPGAVSEGRGPALLRHPRSLRVLLVRAGRSRPPGAVVTSPGATEIEVLAGYLGPFLERQRWFARSEQEVGSPRIVEAEVVRPGRPRLTDFVVEAGGATYHVLVGVREEQEALGILRGQEHAILGPLEDADGHALAYAALADPELALQLLDIVSAGNQQATRVRSVGAEQSNTSLVYDDRLIMKVFRRLQSGRNPDVEVTLALDDVGFNHVAAPVAVWRRDPWDLALVQEF